MTFIDHVLANGEQLRDLRSRGVVGPIVQAVLDVARSEEHEAGIIAVYAAARTAGASDLDAAHAAVRWSSTQWLEVSVDGRTILDAPLCDVLALTRAETRRWTLATARDPFWRAVYASGARLTRARAEHEWQRAMAWLPVPRIPGT